MNKEKLQGYLGKAKTVLGKVPKIAWIAAAAVLIVLAAVLVFALSNKPYTVLVTGSTTDEITSILNWLEEQGVRDYRLEGDKILVPEGREMSLKTQMIIEGYPKTGYLYETYFNNTGSLSTQAQQNRAFLLALQERLGAIVSNFDGVKSATVNLTEGEDNRFILDDSNKIDAAASVTLEMQPGKMLTNEQADAIRNMVAHSVQGLNVSAVSIVDIIGNIYNNSTAIGGDLTTSQLKIQLEEQYQNKIRTQIMQVLVPMFGAENVNTAVNVNVEVSTSTIDDTTVHIPSWAEDGSTNGRGIIGSEIWDNGLSRAGGEPVGGLVGTPSNSEIRTYPSDGFNDTGNEDEIHNSGQIDYNNGQTITHTDRTAAYITDCSVGVSLNSNVATGTNMDDLRQLVAAAAGIMAVDTEELTAEEYLNNRVVIMSTPYPGTSTLTPGESNIGEALGVPMWAVYGLAGGLLLFIILLVIILVLVNKRNKKRRELAEQQAAAEAALLQSIMPATGEEAEPETGADVMSLKTEKSMELRQNIRQFAEENPEIAAQLVKSWLKGDDKDG